MCSWGFFQIASLTSRNLMTEAEIAIPVFQLPRDSSLGLTVLPGM